MSTAEARTKLERLEQLSAAVVAKWDAATGDTFEADVELEAAIEQLRAEITGSATAIGTVCAVRDCSNPVLSSDRLLCPRCVVRLADLLASKSGDAAKVSSTKTE